MNCQTACSLQTVNAYVVRDHYSASREFPIIKKYLNSCADLVLTCMNCILFFCWQQLTLVYLLCAESVDAYVVGDHYTAPWDFPVTNKNIVHSATASTKCMLAAVESVMPVSCRMRTW